MFEHVEPGACDLATLQHLHKRGLVDDFATRGVHDDGVGPQVLEPPRREQMIGRGGMGAIHRQDVHAGQHLVEALPIGGLQLLLDGRRDTAAVVIVDRQAEGLGPAGDRLTDAAHADDAQPLSGDAPPQHPGGGPARPVAAGDHMGSLDHAPRHGENQRHGHVGGILGEDARRIGDGDAPFDGGGHIDIVHPIAEIGDELQPLPRLFDERAVDPVGDGGHKDIGCRHGGGEIRRAHGGVRFIEARLEQLAHPGLDDLGEFSGDDDERFFPHDP